MDLFSNLLSRLTARTHSPSSTPPNKEPSFTSLTKTALVATLLLAGGVGISYICSPSLRGKVSIGRSPANINFEFSLPGYLKAGVSPSAESVFKEIETLISLRSPGDRIFSLKNGAGELTISLRIHADGSVTHSTQLIQKLVDEKAIHQLRDLQEWTEQTLADLKAFHQVPAPIEEPLPNYLNNEEFLKQVVGTAPIPDTVQAAVTEIEAQIKLGKRWQKLYRFIDATSGEELQLRFMVVDQGRIRWSGIHYTSQIYEGIAELTPLDQTRNLLLKRLIELAKEQRKEYADFLKPSARLIFRYIIT